MAKRGKTKPQKQFMVFEYFQGIYPLDRIQGDLEVHLNGKKFELGEPFTVTLIPVKNSSFYLVEA